MKKIIKVFPFIIAIFVTVMVTHAYYSTSKTLPSIFKTDGYVFKLNAGGGTFSSSDKVVVLNGKTTLPTPIRNGYTFLGYSNSSNGNVDYSISVSDIKSIDDKEIYAKWQVNTYTISYNLNGGTITGNKTNYNVEESFTLPTPIRNGYTFLGWTGSNSSNAQTTVTVPKGTVGNLNYNANWSTNSYTVDVNPVIDGTAYNSGLSGYTFDVCVDGTLVADNVIDWCQNVSYGSTVRVKTNSHDGMSTTYDETITVGTSGANISPSWSKNYYIASYYINGNLYTTSSVGYGNTLPVHAVSLNPWEVWDGWNNIPSSMPSSDVRIDGYYHEANCYVWAGHPKAQNGYNIMTQVVKAARNDFTGVTGPYESTSIQGVALWTMHTDSSLKYSQVMAKLPTSMNRYYWWSYAEVHCDNGYAFGYNK